MVEFKMEAQVKIEVISNLGVLAPQMTELWLFKFYQSG